MSAERGLSWFQGLPKVELHVHLEGAIPHEALWQLVRKYGGDVADPEALRRRFEYRDFPHFLETWVWKNQFLREYEDFTFITEAAARDLAGQNIRYAEVFFSPGDFRRQGMETGRIAQAIRHGLDQAGGIEIALVADLVRDSGPESGAATLEQVHEARGFGIIGVGIGGAEQDFPPEAFEGVYARARKLGFRTSAHAGEAAGPGSVWGAIRCLHVDRIGHGTRAGEDERLLDYLVEHQVPVEICPLSNVRTGVVASYEEHPVRRYFDRGMRISINTDDPKMFGNSLAEELQMLVEKKGFTAQEIRSLVLSGIDMSWMPEEKKRAMAEEFGRETEDRGRKTEDGGRAKATEDR